MVTQNIQEVKNFIRSNFNEGKKIISIDGCMYVGKTTLADSFRDDNRIEIISFDKYIEKNTGLYVEVFDFDNLKKTILKVLDSNKNILIEGICLNQILEKISLESEYKVYVKKLGVLGDWDYEKYLDKNKTTDEIFAEDDEYFKVDLFSDSEETFFCDSHLSEKRRGLFYDLVRYHREYEPQDNSDIIFERLQQNV